MNRLILKILQKKLLDWFHIHGRTLPWRMTSEPYAILVAEVMLQQTQVERAAPKYLAFMEYFPSLPILARARTAKVIQAWAGLGYNRRALYLQRTARFVVDQLGGQLPPDIPRLRKLEGIGPYTAAAVACFAFDQQVPVLDTNVKRVLQRVFYGVHQLENATCLKLATDALPSGKAWEWNQALMDLGATICRARNPRCDACPISPYCRAMPSFQKPDRLTKPNPISRNKPVSFRGSSRYYRGRIVALLRNTAPAKGIDLQDLGGLLKQEYTQSELPWLLGLLESLEQDGLVYLKRMSGRVIVDLPLG